MRADRLVAILMLLQRHGRLTARELASTLEVSVRTIYRDMDALSAAGIPVYAERGAYGGCCLVEDYRTDLTGMTAGEWSWRADISLPAKGISPASRTRVAALHVLPISPASIGCWTRWKRKATACALDTTKEGAPDPECEWPGSRFHRQSTCQEPAIFHGLSPRRGRIKHETKIRDCDRRRHGWDLRGYPPCPEWTACHRPGKERAARRALRPL